MKKFAFFGFRNGKLATIFVSKMDNYKEAIECDWIINNPQNAKKQIAQWLKSQH